MIPALKVELRFLQDTFRLEQAGYETLLRGPVMQDLTRRAIRVEAAAKGYARGGVSLYGRGPHVQTGLLWRSISYRLGVDGVSPYVDIGTAVYYAPYVEFGHRNTAHAYPLRTTGGKAVIRNGRQVFGYVTSKPTPAYPFLRPAAYAAHSY